MHGSRAAYVCRERPVSEARSVDEFYEDDLFVVVDFAELDFDDFAREVGTVRPMKRGFDGQLAVAAVDEDEELDALGAAVVEEGVEGGADGAAGVEDVVHQDDVAAVDVEADVAFFDDGAGAVGGEVVAVEADVEDAGVDGVLFDVVDELGEALGERDAAALDADEAEVGARRCCARRSRGRGGRGCARSRRRT